MTSKLDEISEAIGSLRAEVKNLGRKIDKSDETSAENTKLANEHRATIHRRVDELVDEVSDLKSQVNVMDATVKDSKAVTDEVKQWKQRGVGALFMTGLASAAVTGWVVYWIDNIVRLVKGS